MSGLRDAKETSALRRWKRAELVRPDAPWGALSRCGGDCLQRLTCWSPISGMLPGRLRVQLKRLFYEESNGRRMCVCTSDIVLKLWT